MKTAALCIVTMMCMLALMWGAAANSLAAELQRQLDGLRLAYEGDVVQRRVVESGLEHCAGVLKECTTKLEMADKIYGWTAKQEAIALAARGEMMCGDKPCK